LGKAAAWAFEELKELAGLRVENFCETLAQGGFADVTTFRGI
jgi:hypothetical protein